MKTNNGAKAQQVVVNVEKTDKVLFNSLKDQFKLSDKECFAALLVSQASSMDSFQSVVDEIVKAKQIAKVQAKLAKLEAEVAKTKAEVNAAEAEDDTELEPLVVVE